MSQVDSEAPSLAGAPRRVPRRGLLVAFALSGAAALSYEVIWTRALSLVLGSTTYAVASMLATFMLGLAIGGLLGGRVADRAPSPVLVLGMCEFGIAVSGLVALFATRALPELYLHAYRALHLAPTAFFAVQIALCALVMLVPTVLMGMTFPLVTRATVDRLDKIGATVGSAYGANTIGSVLGSLAAGFALIPTLGLSGTAIATALVNFAVGAWLVSVSVGGPRKRALVAAALLALVPAASAVAAGERSADGWTYVTFYSASRLGGTRAYDEIVRDQRSDFAPLYVHDDEDGRVTASRTREGELVLQVNGKVEGTTASDLANANLLAYLPAAAHAAPEKMLVIGLGAGATLRAAKQVAPDVDLVEISEGVLEANRRYGDPGLLDGVRVVRNDARNFLILTGDSYDVISSEPSYPTNYAVTNLFTREYYQLASRRLRPGGVYCQWLPYYLLTNGDVTMMLKTFASVFPFVSVWKVPHSMDLLVLGSRAPFARHSATIEKRVTSFNGGDPLPVVLSRSPEQVAQLANDPSIPINTDDDPVLEFRVARNLRVGDLTLVEQ